MGKSWNRQSLTIKPNTIIMYYLRYIMKQKQSIENELNIPKYDNIRKIGSKSKLLQFFESVKDDYNNLNEWKIFKIDRTYYIDVE